MLLNGFNHVAILTSDSDRLHDFYVSVFEAKISRDQTGGPHPDARLSLIDIGPHHELNVFEIAGNDEATRQTPMFGRGRIDHIGLMADSVAAFREIRSRLMARGATDGFVTNLGRILSVFFTDPDGLECEVCVPNPDYVPGQHFGPGNPAEGFD